MSCNTKAGTWSEAHGGRLRRNVPRRMPASVRLGGTMTIGASRRSRMQAKAACLMADRRCGDRSRSRRIVARVRPPADAAGRERRGRHAAAHGMACAETSRGPSRIRSSSLGIQPPRNRRCEGSPSGADASRRSSRRSTSASRSPRRGTVREMLDMLAMLEVLEVLDLLDMTRLRRRPVVAVAVDVAGHRPPCASRSAARRAS